MNGVARGVLAGLGTLGAGVGIGAALHHMAEADKPEPDDSDVEVHGLAPLTAEGSSTPSPDELKATWGPASNDVNSAVRDGAAALIGLDDRKGAKQVAGFAEGLPEAGVRGVHEEWGSSFLSHVLHEAGAIDASDGTASYQKFAKAFEGAKTADPEIGDVVLVAPHTPGMFSNGGVLAKEYDGGPTATIIAGNVSTGGHEPDAVRLMDVPVEDATFLASDELRAARA